MPALLPIFAKLAGRPCVVVGAGSVAEAKIVALLGSGGEVTVVAPRAVAAVEQLVAAGRIRWVHREFRADDLSGALLAIAATSDPRVNHEVFAESQRLGI
ncbi:MAG: NAD(P)-dependent oxidoreductase, partial [Candidatus Acidiferrales bacterium]